MSEDLFNYSGKLAYLRRACIDPTLRRTDIAVASVLIDYADKKTGACYPSIVRLAEESGVSKTTTMRAIGRLEVSGHIAARKRNGAHSDYLLTPPGVGTGAAIGTGANWNATGAIQNLRKGKTGSGVGTEPVPVSGPEQGKASKASGKEQVSDCSAGRFDDFYKAYPRKEGRPKAESAWRAKKLDKVAEAVLADLAASFAEGGRWQGTEMQFVPLPASYLNGRRWEDVWTAKGVAGSLPRDERSSAEIDEDNEAALKRMGGTHG